MATINGLPTPQTPFRSLSKPNPKAGSSSHFKPTKLQLFPRTVSKPGREQLAAVAVAKELDVIPVQSSDSTDQQDGVIDATEREADGGGDIDSIVNQVVSGFGNEGRLSFEGPTGFGSSSSAASSSGGAGEELAMEKVVDRAINATIVLAAGTFAITKLLTIDHNYWHVSRPALLLWRIYFFDLCVYAKLASKD